MTGLLAIAFATGMLAPINPCGFALLPAYLAYQPVTQAHHHGAAVRPAGGLRAGIAVTAGFAAVYALAGIAVTAGLRALLAVARKTTCLPGLIELVFQWWRQGDRPESRRPCCALTLVQTFACISRVAAHLEAALRALADGNRRTILELVRERPHAVGEIAERVAMSQQAVSHHLRVLRGAGLVTERREGTRHLFAVRTDGLVVVREYLDGFWPTRLAALKRAVERG